MIDSSNAFIRGSYKIVAGINGLYRGYHSKIERDVQAIYVPNVYNGTFWNGRKIPEGDIAMLKVTFLLTFYSSSVVSVVRFKSTRIFNFSTVERDVKLRN